MSAMIPLFLLALASFVVSIYLFRRWFRYKREIHTAREVEIAVLGPAGVGKTVFLATLMRQLTQPRQAEGVLVAKYFSDEQEKLLRGIREFSKNPETGYYQARERATRHIVETELQKHTKKEGEPTLEPENFYLEILETVRQGAFRKFSWRDIPGKFFDLHGEWRTNGVAEMLEKAHGICLLIDARELSEKEREEASKPRIHNYVEAISHRLKQAQKNGEPPFPVWIVLTKGDLVSAEMQGRSDKEWLNQIAQLGAMVHSAERWITCFVELVSANLDRVPQLYHSIATTMKKFHQAIISEISAQNARTAKKNRGVAFTSAVCLLFSFLFGGEAWEARSFSLLPIITEGTVQQIEQSVAQANRYCKYLKKSGFPGYYYYYREQALQQLPKIQEAIVAQIHDQLGAVELGNEHYRARLTTWIEGLTAVERAWYISKQYPDDYRESRHLVEQLQHWDRLVRQDSPPDALLHFYLKLPSHLQTLKEQIAAIVRRQLQQQLEMYSNEANSFTGRAFHPQRIHVVWQWQQRFFGHFSTLDDQFEEQLQSQFRYVWKRYRDQYIVAKTPLEKAEQLQEFRQRIPDPLLSHCPEDILKNWRDLVFQLLVEWKPETDALAKSQQDALFAWFTRHIDLLDLQVIQCRGFETRILREISQVFSLAEGEGKQKLAMVERDIDTFCKDFAEAKVKKRVAEWQKLYPELFSKNRGTEQNGDKFREIASIVARWQRRQQQLRDIFHVSHSIKLQILEYGCSIEPAKELWQDEYWDDFYLVVRIRFAGTAPAIIDIASGALEYKGAYDISDTFQWQAWTPIHVKFIDVDNDIDQEVVSDDDELAGQIFSRVFSLFDFATGRTEFTDSNGVKYWIRCKVTSAIEIPEWLQQNFGQK